MKKNILIFITILLTQTVFAEQSVILTVENMTCALCPITVKKSLQGVNGVLGVDISLEEKTAAVTYDDSVTSTDTLIKATTNAGYPSSVLTGKSQNPMSRMNFYSSEMAANGVTMMGNNECGQKMWFQFWKK